MEINKNCRSFNLTLDSLDAIVFLWQNLPTPVRSPPGQLMVINVRSRCGKG